MNFRYMTLQTLLMTAYSLPINQVLGPSWMQSMFYDITAKVPPGATKEQANIMLQNLLADRLKVVAHKETRDLPVFELTVAKGGVKMKPYVEDPNAPAFERGKVTLDKNGEPMVQPGGIMFTMGGTTRKISASRSAIGGSPSLVVTLATELGRPVIDKTGLTGFYDYKLEYRPATSPVGGPALSPADSGQDAPDLITAVSEQLGLKLESKRDPVEVLVVDSAQKTPADN